MVKQGNDKDKQISQHCLSSSLPAVSQSGFSLAARMRRTAVEAVSHVYGSALDCACSEKVKIILHLWHSLCTRIHKELERRSLFHTGGGTRVGFLPLFRFTAMEQNKARI